MWRTTLHLVWTFTHGSSSFSFVKVCCFFSNNEYNKVGDASSPPHTRWLCVYLDAVRAERRVVSDRWCWREKDRPNTHFLYLFCFLNGMFSVNVMLLDIYAWHKNLTATKGKIIVALLETISRSLCVISQTSLLTVFIGFTFCWRETPCENCWLEFLWIIQSKQDFVSLLLNFLSNVDFQSRKQKSPRHGWIKPKLPLLNNPFSPLLKLCPRFGDLICSFIFFPTW